jgi:enterochelin esterase-like enzyme
MKKFIFLLLFSMLFAFDTIAQTLPEVTSGSITKIENFKSNFTPDTNIIIWLPENYSTKKKYAVLYMHDGQMLFDSNTTWNKQAWEVDEVASQLMKEGKIQDCIVIGIENNGTTRHATYFPQKPFESLTTEQREYVNKQIQEKGSSSPDFQPTSDNYLRFIVKELKPFVDKTYSVYKDKNHTFIAGSSMGGLISMYALCEYPTVFGGAACISTHWPGIFIAENNPIPDTFINYLKINLPNPKTHKIYFDYGDQTIDSMYPPLQKKVDEVLKHKGFTDENGLTKFFPGKDHSEASWKERLHFPLEFLLKK